MTTTYPRIEKMMAGYINMDACEISGSPHLKEQVAYYITRVSPKALRALMQELEEFEREHSDNLTDEFEEEFDFGANIPDAKAFFELVRYEVSVALGEKYEADVFIANHLSSGSFSQDYVINIVPGLGISDEAARVLAMHFAEKVPDDSDILRRNIEDNLHFTGTSQKWLISPLATKAARVDTISYSSWQQMIEQISKKSIMPLSPLASHSALTFVELSLLRQALAIPADMRLTEEYVDLIEKILELRGVEIKKMEPESNPYALTIEQLIQRHERKFTR